ncbi:MAG: thiamine diphosphokinase [Actinomycetota bacterium]|nr:thiamine diphosphokinase [Actinomycetota bacterium]
MGTLIVAGAPVADPRLLAPLVSSAHFVIAADAGADLCLYLDRMPDLFVGDADSVSASTLARLRDANVESVIAPTDKEVSDLDIALSAAAERGLEEVVVCAAWGSRADHTLASVVSMLDASSLRPVLVEPGEFTAWVLDADARSQILLAGSGRTFSVLPGPSGACVSISGARWDLVDARLTPGSRHGLSNLGVADHVTVSISEGSAFVILLEHDPSL